PIHDPPAHFLPGPKRTSAAHINPSRTSGPKVTVARAPHIIPTGRFPFKGVAFKGPPLNGTSVGARVTGAVPAAGASKGVYAVRSRTAEARRASRAKPIQNSAGA